MLELSRLFGIRAPLTLFDVRALAARLAPGFRRNTAGETLRRALAPLLLLCALLVCALPLFAAPPAGSGAAAAQPAGWFGMRLNFDTDGRADPTIKSVTVDDVFPDSPAARAQIAKGDEIISIDGHPVAAAKARQIQGLLHKAVGQSLQLELRRHGGEAYKVAMTAIHLPDSGPPAQ